MPINPLKRLEDTVRDIAMQLDYLLYALFNPFKFKQTPKKISKIIVVETLKLGDTLAATPTITSLRNQYPRAQIDLLIDKGSESILKENKSVNNLIAYNKTPFKKVLKRIKREQYDLGVILHNGSIKSSLLLFLGNVKYRMGCTKVGILTGKGFLLNKKLKPKIAWQHKIQDNLDVIKQLNIKKLDQRVTIQINKKAEQKAKALLKKAKKEKIILHTSTEHQASKWEDKNWIEVSNTLLKKKNRSVIFTGLEKDKTRIKRIIEKLQNKSQAINLCGKTDIQELSAVVKQSSLLISIDTSIIHIASSHNTPTLALFGPTVPTFWGPTGKNSTYIWKNKTACVGCRRSYCIYKKDYECMKSIQPEEVIRKALQLLK